MSLGKATFIHEESLEEDKNNTPFQKRNFSKWIFLKEKFFLLAVPVLYPAHYMT